MTFSIGDRVRIKSFGIGDKPSAREHLYIGLVGTIADVSPMGLFEVALDEDPEEMDDTLPVYDHEIEALNG